MPLRSGGPSRGAFPDAKFSAPGFSDPERRHDLQNNRRHLMPLKSKTLARPASKQTPPLALPLKPERHHFDLNEAPQIVRFMNMTGV